MTTEYTTTSIRVPSFLLQRVKGLSERRGRSVNSLIVSAIDSLYGLKPRNDKGRFIKPEALEEGPVEEGLETVEDNN